LTPVNLPLGEWVNIQCLRNRGTCAEKNCRGTWMIW